MTPNRIVLISQGRYDELPSSASVYPGMLLQENSSLAVAPHAVAGGGGPLMVVQEDALRGGDITQVIAHPTSAVPFRRPARGDRLLMLLQNLQNVAAGDALMSAGDGTLMANPGQTPYNIVAPSTVITNTGTETTFSNGSYTIPANTLRAGDVIHIRGKAFCIAENSTNTHRVRLYINSTTLVDSAALQLAAGDVVEFDAYLTIRTIGATGTFIADGTLATSVAGTFTTTSFTVASTTLDTTAAAVLTIKSLASAASAGNQIRLDEYRTDLNRSGGLNTLVYAAEAINNSAGAGSTPMSGFATSTAAFIRVDVP